MGMLKVVARCSCSSPRGCSDWTGAMGTGGGVMTKISVQRSFEVEAPLEEAWYRLAEVQRWPEWAPHITSVTVSPTGELGPTSSGAFKIRWLGRNTFRMSSWEPPRRWEWIGGLPGVRISYDHRFEPSGPRSTRLEWLVALRGPLAPLVRRVFARIYGRNVDRAIPRLQDWFRSPGPGQGRTAHEQGQRGDG
jgi:uncharacterized membrane protein